MLLPPVSKLSSQNRNVRKLLFLTKCIEPEKNLYSKMIIGFSASFPVVNTITDPISEMNYLVMIHMEESTNSFPHFLAFCWLLVTVNAYYLELKLEQPWKTSHSKTCVQLRNFLPKAWWPILWLSVVDLMCFM